MSDRERFEVSADVVETMARAMIASGWQDEMTDYRWSLVSEHRKAAARREARAAAQVLMGRREDGP